ncbi:hypothetical protein BOTBODRAFT_169302 [Botryobasidium botryosum FD-172 SS1]|uniref:1,3-beta-glucan synthase component FKS1-like domain-containing protein n=1 Tax=Botryobasidium botryosum (strain FD-172 SS1) TaxID=930990 RepID=A0A067N8V1_BOTB1|nr:hypothetical protein BOTBODRAFT_169302 [Botryobasidium botryosum FD-172 SS1]
MSKQTNASLIHNLRHRERRPKLALVCTSPAKVLGPALKIKPARRRTLPYTIDLLQHYRHHDPRHHHQTFVYPTTRNNTSRIVHRLLFLLITLGLTAGPTFYITSVEPSTDSQLPLILSIGIVQFFISVVATLLFSGGITATAASPPTPRPFQVQ